MNASMRTTSARRQSSIIPAASAVSRASGFSQRTCLPAWAARRVHDACRWLGRGMYTASTSGSESRSS